MANKILVIDVETKYTFQEVGGKAQTHRLGISVAGVYNYASDSFLSFREEELDELERLIESSDRLVGFNVQGFDWTVMQPYFSRVDLFSFPTVDIMKDIERALGYRIGLESVAQATLGEGKSGMGLDAIRFYREGKMDELIAYCLDDVRVTRDIYEYGKAHGKVWFEGWEKYPVPVSWK